VAERIFEYIDLK